MDSGTITSNIKAKTALYRDSKRLRIARTSRPGHIRATSLRPPSRGIAKSNRRNTKSNLPHPLSPTQQTTFQIRKVILFRTQRDDPIPGDARVFTPTSLSSHDLLSRPSSDRATPPDFMKARGTKRSAEDGDIELRPEAAYGGDIPVIARESNGMLSTVKEAARSSVDTMTGILAHTRRLWSFFERPAANADGGNVRVKRVKLSGDGEVGRECPGGLRCSSESADGSANPRLQRQIAPPNSDHANQASVADELAPPSQHLRASASTSFTGYSNLPGAFSADDDSDDPLAATALAISTNRGQSPARRSAAITKLKSPQSRSQLFVQYTRSGGTVNPRHFVASVNDSKPTSTETQSPSDDSSQSAKSEADDEKDSLRRSDWRDENHLGAIRDHTALAVPGDSEAGMESLEAFGELKISNLVAEREEEARKAREQEKERERQRIEEERQREERLEEEKRAREEEARRQAEEQRLREEAERRGGLRRPNRDLLPALSADWAARVQQSLHNGGDLAETPETKLRSHDFERLVPSTQWLNDNVVNGSLLWLDRFINEAAGITDVKAQTRKCLMPGSFFFTRLLDHGPRGTERMLRRLGVNKDNILDIETIIMPVCQVNHWTLIVVEPRKRSICHLDSLNPAGSDAKRSLTMEWIKSLLGDSFIQEEWRFVKYVAPRQTNGWDCGVHTVLNGLCIGLGIDPSASYSSDQLPELRRRVAAMLLNQGFKGEFSLEGC
ncbi:uncharacterized protein DNG_08471 [Cephalotrichum gorgonifer]|uniref:Ubiquitin-like protease family profile domain-containing protein n=1 Tax=Cephalotrichum gorgonifer TaxID=2041049 RepID=A0AAE8N556_9PEZI|nr:uncharacterized protein DNG_08471 [Cephalotrichum gorgonifer]